MDKIVITSSPRCGTSLLIDSLDAHSAGFYAGEVLNDNMTIGGQDWTVNADRSGFIKDYNLFKLLSIYRGHEDFSQFTEWGFRVYLYRKDTAAQKRSWKAAARSGQWCVDQEVPDKPFEVADDEMSDSIAAADRMFLRSAHLVISYETMVSDWDCTITKILAGACWPLEIIKQARVRSGTIGG